jgi:transaldolase / glucose-6-phosphate isomerase
MNHLIESDSGRYRFFFGAYVEEINDIMQNWRQNRFLERIWENDWKLWFSEKQEEITNRLGWLCLPERMPKKLDEFRLFTDSIKAAGIKRIVLLGMGGSSLAPEVFQETFRNAPGYPELTVLDSTHPESVRELDRNLDYGQTFFIVSSKSGTTLETRSFYQYFWEKCRLNTGRPGDHFAAVTDSGSPLEAIGLEKKFRGVFLPPDDVGGRYSALTDFGLLPAALIGMDLDKLLQEGRAAADQHCGGRKPKDVPGLILGAFLAGAGKECGKVTIWASASLSHFPNWLEQLIAESTGKNGKGLIPVVNEPAVDWDKYSRDRLFILFNDLNNQNEEQINRMTKLTEAGHPSIQINLRSKYELGREIFIWEMGIAAAGAAMHIHPFNQPDVQLAKDLAKKAMQQPGDKYFASAGREYDIGQERDVASAVSAWQNHLKPSDYIAVQAYLPDERETAARLADMRRVILHKTGNPVTTGTGPRFLHSTGQLHKGGPDSGVFLQLVDEPYLDMDVPESGFTFGQLIQAQALGDFHALKERGRRVLRINLKDERLKGLEKITSLLEGGS